MATTTPNYGWAVPTSTDLVKDGATAIETLGDAIDASMNTALGTKKAGMVLLNTTSFSAVASQSINSVFVTTYDNYRIVVNYTAFTGDDVGVKFRFRASATDKSTNYSSETGYFYGNAAPIAVSDGEGTDEIFIGNADKDITNRTVTSFDVYSPFLSSPTKLLGMAFGNNGTANYLTSIAGVQTESTSFDGFTITPSSGNMTGIVSVYGYNK